MTTTWYSRPEPPAPVAGYVWRAVEAGRDWRIQDAGRSVAYRCRAASGPGHRACGKPSVAALNRGRHTADRGRVQSWWAYCAEHLYGRWIEDGHVMEYRLALEGEEA
jgi:hypothetical protein